MEANITKLKIKEGLPTVSYTREVNGAYADYEASFASLVHEDLQKAMDRLTVHLCFMTELVQELPLTQELGHLSMALNGDAIYEHLAFSSFRCTGFTLSSEGVVLLGRKTLASKKVLNLVSPFVSLGEETDYSYADHLYTEIEAIKEEVRLMLDGKFASQQLDLFQDTAA